jgi:hypothetical protein
METWKSPRKIEEEVTNYLRGRFETYYQRWENGEITREEMVKSMEDETKYVDLDKIDVEELF